ncbi:MAG: hypothetical protein WAZ18_04400 [Alphaproteobacteria bacterium]
MRPTLIALTCLLAFASTTASAGVVLNSYSREAKAAREASEAAEQAKYQAEGLNAEQAKAKMEEANNPFTAAIYATQSKIGHVAASLKGGFQNNTIENIEKDLAKAEKRGDTARVEALKLRLKDEQAKAAQSQTEADEYKAHMDKNMVKVNAAVKEVMVGDGKTHTPIPDVDEAE